MGCGCNKSKSRTGKARRITRRRPGTKNVRRLPIVTKNTVKKSKDKK